MAIYRLEAKAISRGAGRSCVAAAAYRHACALRDERQQLTHEYARKGGVVHSEIIAPADAPDWMRDRESLWNGLDAAEKRRDAITARELVVSLPRGLTDDEHRELVRSFVRSEFTARGIVVDVAIHAPEAEDGERQPHGHFMLADRAVDPAGPRGLSARKDRTLAQPVGVEAVRARWATAVNAALERAGRAERVDHRSLARQRADALARGDEAAAIALDRPPEPKIGSVATAMRREGRGDRAHAWRDAAGVRRVRRAAELAAAAWRDLAREAGELRRRIELAARRATDAAAQERDRLAAAFEAAAPDFAAAGLALQLREAGRLLAERQAREAEERRRAEEQERRGQARGRGYGGPER
jgi:hypothetical protein